MLRLAKNAIFVWLLPALLLFAFLPARIARVNAKAPDGSKAGRSHSKGSYRNSIGWRETDSTNDYAVFADKAERFNNKTSCCIKSSNATQSTKYFAEIFEQFKAEKYRGKRVQFTGYIKTKEVGGWAALSMRVSGPDETIAFDNMENRPVSGTQDWKKCTVVLAIPKEGKRITIGLALHGGGTAWFSNFSLAEVDSNTKTTELPMDESKFPIEGRSREANLDIEWKNAKDVGELEASVPLPWGSDSSSRDYKIHADAAETHRGKTCVCIESIKDEPKGFIAISQIVRAKNYRGNRWRFSSYVKTKDVKDWVGLWMRVDGNDKILGFDNMEKRPIKGTMDWTKFSVVLDLPADCYSFRFGFMLSGKGKAWASDCSLEKIGNDVALTAAPINEPIAVPHDTLLDHPKLTFGVL